MTVTPSDYATSLSSRIAGVLPAAARSAPGLTRRLEAVGLEADELISASALERLPVLDKDDLIERQRADPPFGGFLVEGARPRRLFQSPGPLYEPEPDEADPWRWAPALAAAGIGADDIVLNAFGYHLSPAGAMFEAACRALGATVVPGGIGNKGLQVQACVDLGVTAYIGLPSYLKALLEAAEEDGHHPQDWPLAKAFVSAEPLPPSLRDWLTARVGVVRQGYGTAETGNLGWECEAMTGLHVPADALVQVCDLTTGQAHHDGTEGQIVATVPSASYPMVRFGTGDLSAWMTTPCGCGTQTPRLRGWLGRVGDAVKVRGMFLHPRQAAGLMAGLDEVEAYRFVIDRIDHRDVLRCEVVPASGSAPDVITAHVHERIRAGLRFDAEVTAVDAVPDAERPLTDLRSWD